MRILAALFAVSLLCGCTTLKQLIGITVNPPKVELRDVKIASATLQEINIDLVLEIENTNGVDLSFRDLQYKAEVFDVQITEGVYKETIVAKAEKKTSFVVPLRVSTSKFAKLAQNLMFGGNDAVLKLDAKASFITDAGEIVVDFSDEKNLSK
jgi:LEA14-like dessication related protein